MVESQNSNNQENSALSMIEILRKIEQDDTNEIVFKMYSDNLEAIAKKLQLHKTEQQQLEFL